MRSNFACRATVLHVLPSFGTGGVQIRCASLLNATADMFAHSLCVIDGDLTEIGRITVPVRLITLPRHNKMVSAPFVMWHLLRGMRPNLLVTYGWGAFDAVIASQLARICPVVHHEYQTVDPKARRALARLLLLNRVFKTVVPSKTMFNVAISEFGLRPDRVHLIRNGVDLQHFNPGMDLECRARLGLQLDRLVFGYVGRLAKEKNVQLILRAFAAAQLSGSQLMIVGNGPLRAELEALSVNLGIRGQVIFSPSVRDPVDHLRALDVFLLSSVTEQMPMALLEAMACGLPVVSTDAGDIAYMLDSRAEPEVVCSGDEAAFAASIKTMAKSRSLREALGMKNRNRCLAEFNIERTHAEYRALYQTAVRHDLKPGSATLPNENLMQIM